MSSPGARQRRRRQQYQAPRSRSEVMKAVGAGVGIVAVTGLMIWMLRPGGLIDRQPRSSWLIGITLGALALSFYFILRPKSRIKKRGQAVGGTLVVITAGVVAGMLAWPGGLLRHGPDTVPFNTTPATPTTQTPASGITTTSVAGATTTTAAPAATTTTGP